MCMLYAFSADMNFEINGSLRNFFNYSYKHPHGWGLAVYNKDKIVRMIKGKESAYKSKELSGVLNKRISGKLAIAHIRYATTGNISYTNAHPFTEEINGEYWTFAHNGRIESFNFKELYIKPIGQTDSEKAFRYIQQKLIENNATNLDLKIQVIEEAVVDLAQNSKLNLVISDGTYLYVHCNLKNSLYKYKDDDLVCFATKPVIKDSSKWEPVQLNRLFVYLDGTKVYEGRDHGHEYINIRNSFIYDKISWKGNA